MRSIAAFCFHSATLSPKPVRRFSSNLVESMKLSKQQEQILKTISEGRSVFITGSAGTGKSFLLQQAIKLLKQIHYPQEVFVTASTGVAACALNGRTLHSFAGARLGLGDRDRELLLSTVSNNRQARKRWRVAKALVIDEVSMISGELFDNLEYVARMIRKDHASWGGIQLIVSGDFFQLSPIIDSSEKEFAFEAECWDRTFDLQVELSEVFRQSDPELIDLLQGIRRGRRDDQLLQILHHCYIKSEFELPVQVPRLYPRNEDVKRVNDERLRGLGRDVVKYEALDKGLELRTGIAPDELRICLGARVMLIKNTDLDSGLVNGATGTVNGFVERKSKAVKSICCRGLLPVVMFDCGVEMVVEPGKWDAMEGETVIATRKQLPLIPAWAVSIHKCQGMTLDRLHTDLSRAFGCGMVYVALSRVRSLNGLHLSGFRPSKITAHPKVLKFYEKLFGSSVSHQSACDVDRCLT